MKDIRNAIEALSSGKETEYTKELKKKRGTATYEMVYSKKLSDEQSL